MQDIAKYKMEGPASQSAPAPVEIPGSNEILFNPNVFTEFKLAGSEEASSYNTLFSYVHFAGFHQHAFICDLQEIAADEENVRKVSSYLTEVVLPKFIQDLCTLEVAPMDGETLTEALHAHGINVRYIGKVLFIRL